MNSRLLRRAGALALVVAGSFASVAAAASVQPDPGAWTADAAKGRGGAKAQVRFSVSADRGSVTPAVEYKIRGCGRWASGTLAAVPVTGGRFEVRSRVRRAGARIDLRLKGTFDSEFEAHGTVRATVKRRRNVDGITCKLPSLTWTAELSEPVEDESWEEEWSEEDEYYEDELDPGAEDDYAEDEVEYGEDDEEPYTETPDPAE
jgi:hypothetical protein